MASIGERLKKARQRSGLKQTEVYDKTGINNKTLSGYENAVSEPDIETLNKLSQLYKVSVGYLTGKEQLEELTESQNERILKEIAREYDLDWTDPDIQQKVRTMFDLVFPHVRKK